MNGSPDRKTEKNRKEKRLSGNRKTVYFTKERGYQPMKKTVRVAAALITRDHRIFATQRGYGEFKDGWEFPGGKIEKGETSRQALKREIREELEMEIELRSFFGTVEYEYPEFHLSMDCWWAVISNGSPVLLEHESARWLSRDELHSVNWLPADRTIIDRISDEL